MSEAALELESAGNGNTDERPRSHQGSPSPLEGKFCLIAPSQLTPGRNIRENRSEQATAALARSISDLGILHELLVVPLEGDRFEIVSGFGRWQAALECGLAVVPCRVLLGELSPGDKERCQLDENLVRQDLSPLTVARTLKRKREAEKLTQKALAAYFSIPQPRVSEYLSLLKLSEKDQARLEEGELTWKQACSLAKTRQRKGEERKSAKKINSSSPFVTVNGAKLSLAQALILTTSELVVIVTKVDGGTVTPVEAARVMKAKNLSERLLPFAPLQANETTVNGEEGHVGPLALADNEREMS